MKTELIFAPSESARLRDLLANCLINIFINDRIAKYLLPDGTEMELQILNGCKNHKLEFPQIKTAFYIWGKMEVADRHAVLAKFQHLYAGLAIAGSSKKKTHIFCTLFVREFAVILLEAIAWPD